MSTSSGIAIRRLHSVDDAQIEALADVLIDCVDGDASASFMYPLAPAKAEAFWRRVAAGVAAGERALLVAEDDTGIVVRSSSCSTSLRTSRTEPIWPRCSSIGAPAARGSARR